jgi:hypothetical protein
MLERLETMNPPCYPLRDSVGAIACIPKLRSAVGKARAWIRQVLNTHTLDAVIGWPVYSLLLVSINTYSIIFLVAITTHYKNFLAVFYHPYALLQSPSDVGVMVGVKERDLLLFLLFLIPSLLTLSHPLPSYSFSSPPSLACYN